MNVLYNQWHFHTENVFRILTYNMHGYGNITVPQQSATFGELSDNDGTIAILLMSLAWAWDSNLQ
jgi:hypothetical protein